MRPKVSFLASLVVCVCLAASCIVQPPAQTPGGGAQAQSPVGTYTGSYDEESYVLVLLGDGTARINESEASWTMTGNTIVFSDGAQSIMANYGGDHLSVYLPEGTVTFLRTVGAPVGGSPVAAAPQVAGPAAVGPTHVGSAPSTPGVAPAPPAPRTAPAAYEYSPSNTLAGDVVTSELAAAEFTVPDGWTHGPKRDEQGGEQYTLAPKDGTGGIMLSRRPLGPSEAQQPASVLLSQALTQMAGGQAVNQVVPPEDITVAGKTGARAIIRASVGGTQLELYAAGIVAHGYGYVIAAVYPVDRAAALRPAVDTVIVTFRPRLPTENTGLRAQVLGCWEAYSGNTDRSGSSSTSRKFGLSADGRYWYRAHTYVNAEGAGSVSSDDTDEGRFRVEGSSVVTVSDKGQVGSYQVVRQGGMLMIDGTKFIPCSR